MRDAYYAGGRKEHSNLIRPPELTIWALVLKKITRIRNQLSLVCEETQNWKNFTSRPPQKRS